MNALSSVLEPAGPAAALIAQIAWVLFAGATAIFVGVMVLLVLALRRPAHLRPRLWTVGGGVVFPVLVLSALLAYAIAGSARLAQRAAADAIVVSITGHMWWWEVRYRDPASGADIVLANELRLPVGRDVVVGVTSNDVIHSVWVPSLAGKTDAIPGRVNQLVLRADRAGVFNGPCAEYCGQQHARMTLLVVAEAPAAFDAWLAREAQPAPEPSNPLQARGRDAFVEQRCGACHTVRGVTDGRLGPDLTHVGSRLALGASTMANVPGAFIGWIAAVQSHKPGARMPSFDTLDAATLQALGAYLEHLE